MSRHHIVYALDCNVLHLKFSCGGVPKAFVSVGEQQRVAGQAWSIEKHEKNEIGRVVGNAAGRHISWRFEMKKETMINDRDLD